MKWVKQYRKKATILSSLKKKRRVFERIHIQSKKTTKPKKNENEIKHVPDSKAFLLSTGTSITNIPDLITNLRDCDEEVFQHHVNTNKNDFAKWLSEVFDEHNLAENIKRTNNKHKIITLLDQHIK